MVMLVFNIATGRFDAAFDTPGVIAHSEHLWNILGMYAVGFAAVLAGGCPLRTADPCRTGGFGFRGDCAGYVCRSCPGHNFGLAASATAVNAETKEVVAGSVPLYGKVAVIICIAVCFLIAFLIRGTKESRKMEMKIVDARGLSCPEPVMLTEDALKEGGRTGVKVLVTEPHQRMNVEKVCKRPRTESCPQRRREDGFAVVIE